MLICFNLADSWELQGLKLWDYGNAGQRHDKWSMKYYCHLPGKYIEIFIGTTYDFKHKPIESTWFNKNKFYDYDSEKSKWCKKVLFILIITHMNTFM